MIMITGKDYSKIRWHLTCAMRQLEVLYDYNELHNRPETYRNEYEYWISSLSLLRNCIYGCKHVYDGQINICYAVMELKEEITNFIKVVRDLEAQELAKLDRAWRHLKDIEAMLK